MHSSPGILAVAVLGYLFVIGILAVAVLIVVKSSRKGGASGCTGCAIALAILIAALLGAAGCTAAVAIALGSEAVKHGPVRSIELEWDREQASEGWRADAGEPRPGAQAGGEQLVHLRIEMDGRVDVGRISRWIRDELDGDVTLTYEERTGPEGRRTVLDFGLPIDPDEAAELEAELRAELPELDLPRAVRIEIRAPGE